MTLHYLMLTRERKSGYGILFFKLTYLTIDRLTITYHFFQTLKQILTEEEKMPKNDLTGDTKQPFYDKKLRK